MKQSKIVLLSSTAIVLLLVCFVLMSFNSQLKSHTKSDIERRLRERLAPNIVFFNSQMQEQVKTATTLADFLGSNWHLESSIKTSLLQSAVQKNGLLRCAIAYPDGSFITNAGKSKKNILNEDFFQANMQGKFFVTEPRASIIEQDQQVIVFAAPIVENNGQVVGSVIYSYLCAEVDKTLNLQFVEGQLDMMVVKENGVGLFGKSQYMNRQSNALESLRSLCTHEKHAADSCMLLTDVEGSYLLTTADNDVIYVHYDKLDTNDWYMLAAIDEKVASSSIAFTARMQHNLSATIAGILLIYVAVLLVIWRLQIKTTDPQTGALTIHAFKKRAKKIFAVRTDDNFVVVKLDIKDFKLINRIYSFEVGDKAIRSMAEALRMVLSGQQSLFARVDVDTFVILLQYHGAQALSEKRQGFIDNFGKLMGKEFGSKIIFPTGQYLLKPSDFPYPDMSDIFEKVNFAHRAAKQGGDTIIDYEEDIEQIAFLEKMVEDRMERAIKDEEFVLYLQPKVSLENGTICGAEALVRWKIGDQYYMAPAEFVPVLEKNGFVTQLDKYMFARAASYIKERMLRGDEPLQISVNFSRHHLNNSNFVDELCEIADNLGVPRQYLEIELTESVFLSDMKAVLPLIEQIHAAGFVLSMDDFGSGYSCFAQLKDFKIDVLKLDRDFFGDTKETSRSKIVTAGILEIAKALNIKTVAEGVEQYEQVKMLKELGCDIIQGYYYARPMPIEEFDCFTLPTSEKLSD